MSLTVDAENPIPIYYQLREQIRQQILSGVYKPGDKLPGEYEICNECGISRMTVRQALAGLSNEGLIVRKQGKGSFVATPKTTLDSDHIPLIGFTELISQLGMSAGAQVLSQEVMPAPTYVAEQLILPPEANVVCIVRLRLANGEKMAIETSYYPHDRYPLLADLELTDRSVYHLLKEHYGLHPAYADDTIEIASAGPYEASKLRLSEGMPTVHFTRVSYTVDDIPIEYTQAIYRCDRFKSVVRRSRIFTSDSEVP